MVKTDLECSKELKNIIKSYKDDTECLHSALDDYLCSLLTELGYKKVVKLFNDEDKWYA